MTETTSTRQRVETGMATPCSKTYLIQRCEQSSLSCARRQLVNKRTGWEGVLKGLCSIKISEGNWDRSDMSWVGFGSFCPLLSLLFTSTIPQVKQFFSCASRAVGTGRSRPLEISTFDTGLVWTHNCHCTFSPAVGFSCWGCAGKRWECAQ